MKFVIKCLVSYFGMQTALSIWEMPSCAMSEMSLLPLLSSLRKPSEPVPEKYFEQWQPNSFGYILAKCTRVSMVSRVTVDLRSSS